MNINHDIKNIKIAKRYASALIESAKGCYDEVLDDLLKIDKIIFENKDFKTFFLHPIVSLKDKKDTIKETLQGKIHELSYNFIETLLDENRFNIFRTILFIFQKEVDFLKNKQEVEVISAVDLDEESKQRLKDKLAQKLNKDVILNYEKDEGLLGGFIVKLEDRVIDLSLKTRFETLKKSNLNLI